MLKEVVNDMVSCRAGIVFDKSPDQACCMVDCKIDVLLKIKQQAVATRRLENHLLGRDESFGHNDAVQALPA